MHPHDWMKAFLGRRDLAKADSRPLYAYRCTFDEFEGLREVVRNALGGMHLWNLPWGTESALCLYVSEWWRRNHDGGAWKWSRVLASIGIDRSFVEFYPSFEKGLREWDRDLLRRGGKRMFLITFACEGGLPLQLIRRDNSALRRYFRRLIEDYEVFRRSGVPARELAAQMGSYLPGSLRQDVVFELGGQLVEKIWGLQKFVGNTRTPVKDLDRMKPDWRDNLPLEIEDDTARALLNNLVEDASRVRRSRSDRIRFVRYLLRTDKGWRLEGRVVTPPALNPMQLSEIFRIDRSELPSRFELYVESGDGRQSQVGVVTEYHSRDGRMFRLERRMRDTAVVRGRLATESLGLWLRSRDRVLGPEGSSEVSV